MKKSSLIAKLKEHLWQTKFNSNAHEHLATAKLVLDWYKQDTIKC